MCRDLDLKSTDALKAQYIDVETKLQLQVLLYCDMQQAADAKHLGLKFSWGDPNLSVEQRELLTHDPHGFMKLRESLNEYGIQGTDRASIGPESEQSLEPKHDKVELVKTLIALEEEIQARASSTTTSQSSSTQEGNAAVEVGPKRSENRPPRLAFPENDDDDDFLKTTMTNLKTTMTRSLKVTVVAAVAILFNTIANTSAVFLLTVSKDKYFGALQNRKL